MRPKRLWPPPKPNLLFYANVDFNRSKINGRSSQIQVATSISAVSTH